MTVADKPIIARSPALALRRMRTMAKMLGCEIYAINHRKAIVGYALGAPEMDAETWFCTLPSGGAVNICYLRSMTYRTWRQAFIDRTGDGALVVAVLVVP